ncbi:MAG: bifunctional UDP-3-O-[3-hydroxymyristoyl] N-acetylglucosamine deacetylase/3-hydroxyacyl-ACP dehydratase [Gemmatimonadota bacterium]|jgi:UDP-3-O-[3-hydroxymyristoyl] N-acetylglucosamine deacetylase/3-hydroxyacyl-[acyl-carrier-protein] dehydratase|nr:bifunctional UDP-3-O-[3-hydroxymyristoyl] N-acetylglucosamine deacetylase/3-hydroxyacyl-ACP dehydratase [Gemmatimonadota bacterium]
MTHPRQQTLSAARELEGTGLHTGAPARLRLVPADVQTGIRFRRIDLEGSPEIAATVANVVDTDRGTTIGENGHKVHTIEHILSALVAAGVDNVVVELDGPEPPAGDGSARLFTEMIESAGVVEQDAPAKYIEVAESLSVTERDSSYTVSPASGYEVSVSIRFDHPLIGRQFASYEVDRGVYAREIASARTFGFLSEVEALRSRGLGQGGSPRNAILLTDTGLYEDTELRFPDEFARHKVLDVIGDLGLLGARLKANVVALRPSHRGNVALAREILSQHEKRALARPILDIQQILQYLPHRYPFLLVDRVVEYEERKRIIGLKNVTMNEPFFQGHFPGQPIMPGVLIVEAMGQVGGLLLMDSIENPEEKIVYFMALDNVKWRRPVTPGDQIRFEVEVLQIRGRTARMKGVGTVDGHVVAEAEMMARVVDK